jgi:uncharacterized protein
MAGPKANLVPDQYDEFIRLALRNPANRAILDRLPSLGAADCWLVAGCLYQAVWNVRSGRPPEENVKDYDVFYCDPADLSYQAEDQVIRRAAALFADLGVTVEVKNQARVHLWYRQRFGHERTPIRSSFDGIGSFLVTGTCVGLRPRPDGAGYEVAAPYGLDDMFAGINRPNPGYGTRALFEAKAASYAARWPWLTTVPWRDGDEVPRRPTVTAGATQP